MSIPEGSPARRLRSAAAAVAVLAAAASAWSHAWYQIQSSSEVVNVTVTPGRMSVRPGDVVPIAVILDHRPKWHTQAGREAAGEVPVDPDSIPTRVAAIADDGQFLPRSDSIQWPKPSIIESKAMGALVKLPVFKDRAIIYLPLEVPPDARTGNANVGISVTYQACDDRICLAPVEGQRFDLTLAISPTAPESGWTYPELFAEYRAVPASLPSAGRGPGTVSPGAVGTITIMTAVLVAVGVIGVVILAVIRRSGASPSRPR